MTETSSNDRMGWRRCDRRQRANECELPELSVVIPTLNEAVYVGPAVNSASAPGVEIIVVDGGSSDATVATAEHHGARVLSTAAGRGQQLAAGAAAARGEAILFLHADARLPEGFAEDVRRTLAAPQIAMGAFRLRIDASGVALRVVEWGVRQRCRFWSLPYGDQAFFLRAETYRTVGGFRSITALEDLEFVRRVGRYGRVKTLDRAVVVSARAWRRHGVVRTTLRNLASLAAYFGGVDFGTIARRLRRGQP